MLSCRLLQFAEETKQKLIEIISGHRMHSVAKVLLQGALYELHIYTLALSNQNLMTDSRCPAEPVLGECLTSTGAHNFSYSRSLVSLACRQDSTQVEYMADIYYFLTW